MDLLSKIRTKNGPWRNRFVIRFMTEIVRKYSGGQSLTEPSPAIITTDRLDFRSRSFINVYLHETSVWFESVVWLDTLAMNSRDMANVYAYKQHRTWYWKYQSQNTPRQRHKAKEKYRGVFEIQKSGDKTSSGEIGLYIRTHASPKVGQDQVSGGVSVLCKS